MSQENTQLVEKEQEEEIMKQLIYKEAVSQMFKSNKEGSLIYYFKDYLSSLNHDEWWSQPQAQAYCNKRVVEAGGVNWHTKSGAKKNPDGTPATFGDPGRTLEKFRMEDYEGCWDNKSGNQEGPFRLNLEKYKNYTGPTKCHGFTEANKKEIHKRSDGKCELCGHKGKIEIDHFIPKEKGGLSELSNANALCSRCNDRKCAKEPEHFMAEEFDRMRKYFTERGMGAVFDNHVKNSL